MANIKSAKKRARQAIVRRDHNMSLRTQVRTAIKNVKKAVASGNKSSATKTLQESQRFLDRPGTISQIEIKVEREDRAGEVRQRLSEALSGQVNYGRYG